MNFDDFSRCFYENDTDTFAASGEKMSRMIYPSFLVFS